MNSSVRIEALKSKHHNLEQALDSEAHRALPDDLQIATLKRQKLALKDEIAGLEAHV